jgi:predicted RNase H-like HicB family nuclease
VGGVANSMLTLTVGYSKEEATENLNEALDCYFAYPDQRLDQFISSETKDE